MQDESTPKPVSQGTYHSIRNPKHPLARQGGKVALNRMALFDAIGPGPHPCHWCGIELHWATHTMAKSAGILLADHVDGNRDNNDPSNLVPSCHRCNVIRASRFFITTVELSVPNGTNSAIRTRAIRGICTECGTEYIRSISNARRPKAQYCSRSCRTRSMWRRWREAGSPHHPNLHPALAGL